MKKGNRKKLLVNFTLMVLAMITFTGFILSNQQIMAATTYSVDYTQNDWGFGATVNITITNNTSSPIDSWSIEWAFSGNQTITNMWNASFIKRGAYITATNLQYNSAIPAHGTVSFGFNLAYSGTNEKPTDFIVNGSVISTTSPPPTATQIASPTPTPTGTLIVTPTPSATLDSNALLIGRFDTSDPDGPKFAWSATTIKAKFEGTSIGVNLKSTGDNWFNVIIDNEVKAPVNITSSTQMPVTLASGLTSGTHTIELVKRTEAWVGDVQFLGFSVGNGKLITPPGAATRRIEFIGDSITCGYGNEGTSQYQSFTTKNENAYLAYGSIAARALGADQITVAWSGKGVVRNYGGDTNEMLPELYSRILPYNSSLIWNSGLWTPQVVVINLGTNDFSIGAPEKNLFTTTYSNFVKKIRSQYSGAHIYCALGPMLGGDNLSSARDYLNTVVNALRSAGDSKVHFIEFPMQDGTLGYGEDWHPSVATHTQMAQQLVQQIKVDLGW
ncbi:MAG TPA: cellulose binding domain-containing protein [Bacillota bacterium]|nr:cellulose binding domain-containing protein [Bacillota bacterium]